MRLRNYAYMTEKPIIFNAEMVRAILDGRKSQTRRVIKNMPEQPNKTWYFDAYRPDGNKGVNWNWWEPSGRMLLPQIKCPYGKKGDRLYVKETWGEDPAYCDGVQYKADWTEEYHKHARDHSTWKWKSPRYMPRTKSRINLEIIDIRVEKIQDITVNDAGEEGISDERFADWIGNYKLAYKDLWDSVNKKRGYGWDTNPWAWVMEFKCL